MTAEAVSVNPEFNLAENERIMLIGAGGRMANAAYIPRLLEMGVLPEQFVLVDIDDERLAKVQERLEGAASYKDLDHALAAETKGKGNKFRSIFVLSSTGAHGPNLLALGRAADNGDLDFSETSVICEKPVTDPEEYYTVLELASSHPDFDVAVGYILRFSETLSALDEYMKENGLTITSLDWLYGKDRTTDDRPTQGVHPDEDVHPISVTNLILERLFARIAGVDAISSRILTRPFADPVVQEKARINNPAMPEHPTSDVDARLMYSVEEEDGTIRQIPVSMYCSFLLTEEVRRVKVKANGPDGPETLLVDFDTTVQNPDGSKKRVDTLRTDDGTIIFEWESQQKSARQIAAFLMNREGLRPDALTTLEGENTMQNTLRAIGERAVRPFWHDFVGTNREQ